MFRMCVLCTVVSVSAAPAAAQWVDHPTAGLPRLEDGTPNLSARTPRTPDGRPDLSGLWRLEAETDIAARIEAAGPQEWVRARRDTHLFELGRNDPGVLCLPSGPRASLSYGFAAKIVQTPALILFLYEDLTYRQIFVDGRDLPDDPNPSWMGYSTARWDGDTLVVSSTGYTDRSLLDFDGHPHTEALRVTERFRRRNLGTMEVEVTFDDPGAFARPAVIPLRANLVADTELLEYVCQENERSRAHMIGTAEDDRAREVSVPEELLRRYVGTYRMPDPNGGEARDIVVRLQEGQLLIEIERGPTFPALAVSTDRFAARGMSIAFVIGDHGPASALVVTIVEGDFTASRVDTIP